jgi:hypothetical protein
VIVVEYFYSANSAKPQYAGNMLLHSDLLSWLRANQSLFGPDHDLTHYNLNAYNMTLTNKIKSIHVKCLSKVSRNQKWVACWKLSYIKYHSWQSRNLSLHCQKSADLELNVILRQIVKKKKKKKKSNWDNTNPQKATISLGSLGM